MDFQYRDPDRGFDRAAVKGVVARLVRVKDPATTTALEVAAGGKLYQVHHALFNEIRNASTLYHCFFIHPCFPPWLILP